MVIVFPAIYQQYLQNNTVVILTACHKKSQNN